MTGLDHFRRAAADLLREHDFDGLTDWRLADNNHRGRSNPRCIAPVCPHKNHERGDAGIHSCCPGPVVDIGDQVLAEYLVALLNEDRRAGDAA